MGQGEEVMNGKRLQLMSSLMSLVAAVALSLGAYILNSIDDRLERMEHQVITHLKDHPDSELDRRISVIEDRVNRLMR